MHRYTAYSCCYSFCTLINDPVEQCTATTAWSSALQFLSPALLRAELGASAMSLITWLAALAAVAAAQFLPPGTTDVPIQRWGVQEERTTNSK